MEKMSELLPQTSKAEMVGFRTQQTTSMTEGHVSRQAQEVQAAMVIAKKFPRDELQAYNRIKNSCKRKGLAENAVYSYPKGGTRVEGPSIRLAEALAQAWGNIDYGVIELERKNGESSLMAYCWDLETNTRQTKIFSVAHEYKAHNQMKKVNDPRDVYELTANQGARRLRACILGVIPGDVVDMAVYECNETLFSSAEGSIKERTDSLLKSFQKCKVSKEMIELRLGYNIDAINEHNLVELRKIYLSLKDGMSSVDDWFKKTSSLEQEKKETKKVDKKKTINKEPSETDQDLENFLNG